MWTHFLQSRKTVLITGANKGIGKEVARQLASRGFQVFLGSRDEDRGQAAVDELRASGLSDVHLLLIDVTSDQSVRLAAEALATKIIALDVLINNSGILAAGMAKPVLEETIEEVIATYDVNVFGLIRTTNAFIELLKKSKHPRIVNVSSGIASLTVRSDPSSFVYNFPSHSYSSSKSAVNHLTLSYARALSEFDILVNAVDPGYTATDGNNHTGPQKIEEGAIQIVAMSTIEDDGPTGTYSNKDGILPW